MGPLTHGKSLCNNGCHSGEGFHINSDREIACFWSKASAKSKKKMYDSYNLVYKQVQVHVCTLKCEREGGRHKLTKGNDVENLLHVLGLDAAQNMAPKQFRGMVGMVFQAYTLYAFPFSSSQV